MARHNDLGKWGEDVAQRYLSDKGYTIRERDWKIGHRDIDIIAVTPDGMTVAFVEVKTRTTAEIMSPEDAVDDKKMRNLCYAANDYVKMFDVSEELRFDVITVVGTDGHEPTIDHIEDAFNPLLLF